MLNGLLLMLLLGGVSAAIFGIAKLDEKARQRHPERTLPEGKHHSQIATAFMWTVIAIGVVVFALWAVNSGGGYYSDPSEGWRP